MATWFTSDEHFGHHNILHYCSRPFLNTDEMDSELIALWNDVVDKDDTVYCLGDFTMNHHHVPKIVARLNGHKHLICGNHDKCFKEVYGLSKANRWQNYYREAGFLTVNDKIHLNIAGRHTLLCHFPYQNPAAEDQRYQDLRPKEQGAWLLHGHRHSPPGERLRGRQIDVGVDGWGYRPVRLETIEQIMMTGVIDSQSPGSSI